MRILLISRCPPWPLYLGDRLIVYHLAEELEARRHRIDLLAYANRPEDWNEQGSYYYRFEQVELFAEPPRSPLSYLKRALLPPARWPRRAEDSWSPDLWRAIQRRLDTEHYDVIHLFGGILVYEFYHALRGLPALITPYESYSLYLRRAVEAFTLPHPNPFPRVERGITPANSPPLHPMKRGKGSEVIPRLSLTAQLKMAQHFERWMFEPYRRVVVVSDRDRDELLHLNPALPVEVIPNGIDLYEFRFRQTRLKAPALLFVGNYEYAPNVDAALRLATDIFPAVKQRVPTARLWLVGNAPPPELRALASDDVRVTGRVPDVKPYLARAAAFVTPLRLGAGIKNKVLEALAVGCPVVATPLSVDGIAVQHGHDALVADGGGLADAVVRLLENPDLAQTLAANGRKLIEAQYSWDRVAERYEQLYQSILK
jgi:glycosyltransferase involved in cell wall biosynthesis